jgi:hypothetical protein
MPVDGPPRCETKITQGTSAMTPSPSISTISASPGPEVAVAARTPA